jgi:hypothetical protein
MSLAKKVGKVCLSLAAGGMVLNPAVAQQGNSASSGAPSMGHGVSSPRLADKEVTLAPDGSFRAAVLTADGSLVPGADVAFASPQKDAGDPLKTLTGTRGLTTVAGLKPGLYRVRVRSPQGTYDGTLLVRNVPVTNVSFMPPPLVMFMLTPSHPPCQDQDRDCRREGLALEELEGAEAGAGAEAGIGGAGLLLPVLGLTAGAAAIALPIALSHHHHRRASP